ncbi:MAG: hypothetical protein BYD32DRAFT_491999 [Podila humilis]|nr:MAG: hypothetical protein BYD32DRAFT_491999 [Podila humilis]
MSFFKSSKNQTSSAAPSASATPVQSPRSSMQASRPKDQPKMTVDQVLEMAMKKSGATFHQLPLMIVTRHLMQCRVPSSFAVKTEFGDEIREGLDSDFLVHVFKAFQREGL